GRGFEAFARDARPRLVRALAPSRGQEALEGASEALAYAWEHWDEVRRMENPLGYLFRVGPVQDSAPAGRRPAHARGARPARRGAAPGAGSPGATRDPAHRRLAGP